MYLLFTPRLSTNTLLKFDDEYHSCILVSYTGTWLVDDKYLLSHYGNNLKNSQNNKYDDYVNFAVIFTLLLTNSWLAYSVIYFIEVNE